MQRMLSEEQYLQVAGRCAMEGMQTHNSRSICQRHHDQWLQHFKPAQCAACPQPLSVSGWRRCPEWRRKQLGAQHGAFVHKQPCYEEALAAKKQQAADPQPMEVKPAPIFPCQSFQLTSAGMCAHRSTFAFEPKLTRGVALLACNSSAQATSPSLWGHHAEVGDRFFCHFPTAATPLRRCLSLPLL